MVQDSNSVVGAGIGTRILGDFELLEEIGRGGMGMVYRARQLSMDRMVALKVLPSFAGMNPESVARFHREAAAAGRLSHPGIVPIYAVGELEGTHFYAMELVEGPSLFQLLISLREIPPGDLQGSLAEETALAAVYPSLKEMPVPGFHSGCRYAASCASLIMEVAGALTAAHEGKIIHRDLKPSNILLHPGGRPLLVDFGLARDEMAYSFTQTGDAVGTPSYMAPEQAAGLEDLDARVDVYGLGATLYEMLVLQPPFDGMTSGGIMQQLLYKDPVSLRKLNPRVPPDLEAIVMTCLAKDRERRYESAAALQDDLRAFLAGDEVQAKLPSLGERLLQRLRHNRRRAFVALVSLLFAVLVGLMVALVSLHQTRQSGREALQRAKDFLSQGMPTQAHAAYGQASVLLKDDAAVAAVRFRHMRQVFAELYQQRKYQELRSFFQGLPAAERDSEGYREMQRRLSGYGHLQIAELDSEEVAKPIGEFWVRGLRQGELAAEWQALLENGELAIGHYLLASQLPAMARVVQPLQVRRDETLQVQPHALAKEHVPAGMQLVLDKEQVFAVDRTEFTRGSYQGLLRSLDDAVLVQEMRPLEWQDGDKPYLPVRGVSFWQARLAAALSNKHLCSEEEYLQAATAGLPEMNYPWGRSFDVNRVVGDPKYTSATKAANSTEQGASPYGLLHLVGNVAEILAAGRDGSLQVAGGHYLSQPADLTATSRQPLASPSAALPTSGFRLARFLPQPDQDSLHQVWEKRCQQLLWEERAHSYTDWSIQANGQIHLLQRQVPAAAEQNLHFCMPPPQHALTVPVVEDQDARPLGWKEELDRPGQEMRVSLAGVEGCRYVQVQQRLHANNALVCLGDSYLLQLPLASSQPLAMQRLVLPPACRLLEVWPAPDQQYYIADRLHLCWELEGLPHPARPAAFVRFRKDGGLTDRWPAMGTVRDVLQSSLANMQASEFLAPDFQQVTPGKLALAPNAARFEQYENPQLLDVLAIGDMVQVDLLVDWQTKTALGEAQLVKSWPLRAFLRRSGTGIQLTDLLPASGFDLGHMQGLDYQHPRLKAEMQAQPGVEICRMTGGCTEMQLVCLPAQNAPYWLVVRGCYSAAEPSQEGLRRKLLAGDRQRQRGERLAGSKLDFVGATGSSRRSGRSEHWLFQDPLAQLWYQERWTRVIQGHRHFMVQAIAVGSSRQAARQAFQDAASWFDRAAEGLRIY